MVYILQEELRPFFSLPKVMDGLFNLAKMLFGIDIEPADGRAPVIYIIHLILLCFSVYGGAYLFYSLSIIICCLIGLE